MPDSSYLAFPLRLTDKAARALNGVPEEDCPKHANTVYEQIPRIMQHLSGGQSYACMTCYAEAKAAWDEQQAQHLRERRARREQRREAFTTAKHAAVEAQDRLRVTLSAVEQALADQRSAVEQARASQAEASSHVSALMREVVEIEEHMRTLRAQQQVAKAKLEAAKARVSCAISEVNLEQKLREIAAPLAALTDATVNAWHGSTKSYFRKHADRPLLVRATQLLDTLGIAPWKNDAPGE